MSDEKTDARILDELFKVIKSRYRDSPETSYTAKLFAGGLDGITAKIDEEAAEAIAAALGESGERVSSESADLLYHLLVMWAARGIEAEDVWAELKRREGMSGISEKKGRK
ncbi:MAG: phosphoribosyl-ATP diphosphatase [Rhodospirillaceae bacterium]|nr:phosphoribosyl-ATP diphosphatase [Rhodospirillaceae bacterium]